MKKFLLCSTLFLAVCAIPLAGQDYSRKFGKITDYEADMTTYDRDTSAVAVYLYEDTRIQYDLIQGDIGISLERICSAKIKVLKPEGVSQADIQIPFMTKYERISDVDASSYNREGGKIVETELKGKDAVTEKVSDDVSVRKFSIPNVRAGSVIEYKYVISSRIPVIIHPIAIQHDIPVVYSFTEAAIPEYFIFNVNTQGGFSPKGDVQYMVASRYEWRNNVYTTIGEDIPALRSEPFVWCMDDYETKINFELRTVNFPGQIVDNYTNTWEKVDATLSNLGFDSHLKMRNPLRSEVESIKKDNPVELDRVRAILKLVLDRMNWNGNYRLMPEEPRKRLAEGSGSSADINFVLNAALRDAGFTTTPILLSPRRYGRLPFINPSLDNIRTFVLLVALADGSHYIVDGTDPGNDINLIPLQLMVDRARVYGTPSSTGWIDLSGLTPNVYRILATCTLDETGLTGEMTRFVQNARTYGLKNEYREAGSEDKYVESLEADSEMTITSFAIEGLDTPKVTETIGFAMGVESAGDRIYLNAPVIDFLSTSLLTRQDRVRPVEFPYPEKTNMSVIVTLPEGYEVEEVPEPIRMSACDQGVDYYYQALTNGNQLVVRLDLNINEVLFEAEWYPDLFRFFGLVAEKSNARIVLKKIQ